MRFGNLVPQTIFRYTSGMGGACEYMKLTDSSYPHKNCVNLTTNDIVSFRDEYYIEGVIGELKNIFALARQAPQAELTGLSAAEDSPLGF